MNPSGQRKCAHCNQFFVPDVRQRERQRHCAGPQCRRASKAASQRRWLLRPENRDYFRGPENVQRVQAWRAANPSRPRRPRRQQEVLQETMNTQPRSDEHTELRCRQSKLISGANTGAQERTRIRQRLLRFFAVGRPPCAFISISAHSIHPTLRTSEQIQASFSRPSI